MKKRIYLSGPISGKTRKIAEAQFDEAYDRLKKANPQIHIFNPFDDVPPQLEANAAISQAMRNLLPVYTPTEESKWSDCMRIAIEEMVACHEIYMLPGWRESKGAVLEHHIALALGMPVTYPDGEEPQEQSGFPEIDWTKLRRRFFDQCTEPVGEDPALRKISYAPHDFLEWLRENIGECREPVWLAQKTAAKNTFQTMNHKPTNSMDNKTLETQEDCDQVENKLVAIAMKHLNLSDKAARLRVRAIVKSGILTKFGSPDELPFQIAIDAAMQIPQLGESED